ncbi:hypothetical protein [Pilimelia terevasa]|nr:hypothetical protein [Pilimelia terevasa]
MSANFPADPKTPLRLRHLRPHRPEHWAVPPPPPTAVPDAATFVPAPLDAAGGAGSYSHGAEVTCGECGLTVAYRRLSDRGLAREQARRDRGRRWGRRMRAAAAGPALGLAVLAAAVGNAVPAAAAGLGGLLLLWLAWRGPGAAPPVSPHVVPRQPGHPDHDVTAAVPAAPRAPAG